MKLLELLSEMQKDTDGEHEKMKVKRYCPVGVGERLQRAMYDKNMDAV